MVKVPRIVASAVRTERIDVHDLVILETQFFIVVDDLHAFSASADCIREIYILLLFHQTISQSICLSICLLIYMTNNNNFDSREFGRAPRTSWQACWNEGRHCRESRAVARAPAWGSGINPNHRTRRTGGGRSWAGGSWRPWQVQATAGRALIHR